MVRPTLRQFSIFRATVAEGSAGGAARRLGLSQPAVTHALGKLDALLGTPLLTRGQGGSAATAAGMALDRRVTRMRDRIDDGIAAITAHAADDDRVTHRAAALTSTHVRTHIAIAEQGSFQGAARALGISPPALNRTAHDLERLIGVPLYRRLQTSIAVTDEGAVLARCFQIALREIEQAIDEIAMQIGAADGRVALGCLPLMPKPMLAEAIGRLLGRFPTVAVSLVEESYDVLMQALRSGRLDAVLGALRAPHQPPEIVEEPLFEDPYVVVAHRRHGLSGRRSLSSAMLARQAWVAPNAGTPRRAALERLFDGLPQRPRIALETNSVAMMIATLGESECLALGSRAQALTSPAASDLVLFPTPAIGAPRHVGIACRADWLPTTVQRAFVEILRTLANESAVIRA